MPTVKEFLASLREARQQWEEVLSEIAETEMAEPGTMGDDWSVKDVVAHIAWFERQALGILQAGALVGSDLWNLPTDERNAAVFELVRARTLSDVLDDAADSYARLEAAIAGLSHEQLNDPAHFEGMPADWKPYDILAQNSTEHYEHHTADLRAWLDQSED